jgi:RNA polymerase sigma-70 factor (ECF subfamily)
MEAVAAMDRDAQLMLQVRSGDDGSFALLLDRYRTPIVHFLFRMVGNQAVAEELAQEVFLRVYRSRASYEASAKFSTWLYRIATHVALNALRDGRKERQRTAVENLPLPDGAPSPEQRLVAAARAREIRAAVEALPQKQRAAVVMHKYLGLGYAQISEVLHCSESATKSLLFRAYETLRGRLAHLA